MPSRRGSRATSCGGCLESLVKANSRLACLIVSFFTYPPPVPLKPNHTLLLFSFSDLPLRLSVLEVFILFPFFIILNHSFSFLIQVAELLS